MIAKVDRIITEKQRSLLYENDLFPPARHQVWKLDTQSEMCTLATMSSVIQ